MPKVGHVVGSRFPAALLFRARCSIEERQTLLPLVRLLLHCHQRARYEGILALEEIAVDDAFLQALLHRLVEGISVRALEGTLLSLLQLSPHTGKALLRRLLMVEAALSIAEGTHPNLLARGAFHGLLGEEFFGLDLTQVIEPMRADVTTPEG